MSRICPENDLPVACSVCLQAPAVHDPRLQYVNFEAGYDGPVIRDNPNVPGVYVENIVICERCVRQAGRLLGMEDADTVEQEAKAWRDYAEALEKDVKSKDRQISNLNYTVGELIDSPVKRPPGRPQYAGPDSHKEEIKELASKRSRRERLKKATAHAKK